MTTRMPLAQCRVLVTRPTGQAQPLMAAIEQQGGTAFHFPLLAITALHDDNQLQACKQRLMALDLYQHVIFVSTNAVRFGMEWIDAYWPQLPVGIHWHGIGSSTCQAMAQADLPIQSDFNAAHPMNSEALLASPALQSLGSQKMGSQKVLIVRGVGGREHLQSQLIARGAQVDIAECYQRSTPTGTGAELLELINAQLIGTICINSGDSLNNLCALLDEQRLNSLKSIRLIVPSQRVAELAAEKGFGHVKIANNASDSAVLAALLDTDCS